MDLFAKCAAYTTARECREKGIYPYFHALESRQDTEVIMEGRRRIMLGSNNYLGLTAAPEVVAAAEAALAEYGTGCSGSRFLNGTLRLHLELERELADFVHMDGAVTFSTGFQSNLGIISALVGHGDYVICDKENHASIYDGCRLSFMGLPCPNLGTGGYAFHRPYEHITVEGMDKCVEIIRRIVEIYA